jgi:hypothetical protein
MENENYTICPTKIKADAELSRLIQDEFDKLILESLNKVASKQMFEKSRK